MATPPGGGGEVPQAGYYPDPSIPGYIRYWNGGAWVPGTSRPAPSDDDAPPRPPAAAAPAGPVPASAPAAAPPAAPERPAASVPAQAQPQPPAPSSPAREQPPVQEQPRAQAAAQVPAQAQAPVPEPVAARPRAASPAPAPARKPAPVPTVEETGPVFLDEEPAPAEPASAWQADTSRQTGFGGDRDRKVSWGAPRTPDPRTPAEWPVAGEQAEAQTPAPVHPPAQPQPQPQPQAQAPAPARPADPRPTGGAARLGGMPVTPVPTPAPAPRPAPEPAAPAPAPSWAQPQQAQPQPQPQPQASPPPEQQQPVAPWKPPVEDPFLRAARAQASARPAGLGRRLVARLVDSVVMGALAGAAALPFLAAALDHIEGKIEAARQSGTTVQVWLVDSTTSVQFGAALAALVVVGLLYEVLPTARWGRTLGKKLCGIQVRDIEAHEPPTFGGALKRWLVHTVLGLLAVGVLNVLWCVFDRPWRQCWHDKAARTFVAR
ncbi:RDD family protein [Streptomyces sp. NPDC057242]|uniref:RDD family protein n=1 Tax=unclassified Streptomyces TaxID=2593676 RepID=UPI003633A1BC